MHIEQSDFHDQLVRGLAHKMNNILGLFQGYLDLMLDDKNLDRETLDGLACIREGAQTAAELMNRTTAFTKPAKSVWCEVELKNFFQQMTPSLQALCEREVTLKIVCEENLPPLWVDLSRLRMALMEVVRNACEASRPGGSVMIEARAEAQNREAVAENAAPPISWIAITVTDEGNGIAREITEKIFQPFFTTKQRKNAMGLGLSMALGLMQQLGGVIRFTSKAGRTAFRLLLPLRFEPA